MLSKYEKAKICREIPDFNTKTKFSLPDLQKYDPEIIYKIQDRNIYTLIADINLHMAISFYGGNNVFIYRHISGEYYIYEEYCWGD